MLPTGKSPEHLIFVLVYMTRINSQTEMYAGRVASCPLVSHDEYADGTDRQTDGRQTVTSRFLIDAASFILLFIMH